MLRLSPAPSREMPLVIQAAPRTDFCIRRQLARIAPRSRSPMDRRRLSALYLGPVRRGSPLRTRPGRRAPRRPAGVSDRVRSHNA